MAVNSLQPGLTEHHNNLGRAFFYAGRHREAIESWSELLERGEPSAEICFNIGLAYAKVDELEKATEWWRKVAADFPDHPQAAEARRLLKR